MDLYIYTVSGWFGGGPGHEIFCNFNNIINPAQLSVAFNIFLLDIIEFFWFFVSLIGP
jgi:hypothetical protein